MTRRDRFWHGVDVAVLAGLVAVGGLEFAAILVGRAARKYSREIFRGI